MVEYPSSRGCGCPSVLPRPPKLSLQCFLLQPRDWDVAKGLTGLRHCTGGLVMITDYSKPCGIWSMCKLQLGDSHPFCSAEPKASWIVQRTAEFKAFSYLWPLRENGLMLKASNQHGGDQFGPGSRRGFGLRNTSTSPRESPALFPNYSAALVGAHFPPSGRGCRKEWHKTHCQT